ncbi:hypothetical protein L195_g051758, partial [Trifolium pratense]
MRLGWFKRGCGGGSSCGEDVCLWEEELLVGLLEALPVLLLSHEEDAWSWELEEGGAFK